MNAQLDTSTETASTTGPEGTPSIASVKPAAMVRTLTIDIGLPLAAYYVLHLLGVSDVPALLAATAIVVVRIIVGAVRTRTLNLFAAVMLVVFGLSTALTIISGDPTIVLLKNPITTGVVGVVFLVSVRFGRPLTLAAGQSFHPARSEELAEQYHSNPNVRRGHRVTSVVWGTALALEALVRVPLVYLLPISVMVGLGEALTIAVLAALTTWNVWYLRRARVRLVERDRRE